MGQHIKEGHVNALRAGHALCLDSIKLVIDMLPTSDGLLDLDPEQVRERSKPDNRFVYFNLTQLIQQVQPTPFRGVCTCCIWQQGLVFSPCNINHSKKLYTSAVTINDDVYKNLIDFVLHLTGLMPSI